MNIISLIHFGPSIALDVATQFIIANASTLSIDSARTYHSNGNQAPVL